MKHKLRNVVWGFLVAVLALPDMVWAQSRSVNPGEGSTSVNPGGFSGGFQNPLAFDSLEEFFAALLDVIVQIGFPLIVLAVVFTGFLFVAAQGNEEKLNTAKRAFLWTVVGALIVLGAKALSLAIQGTVDQLQGVVPMMHFLGLG